MFSLVILSEMTAEMRVIKIVSSGNKYIKNIFGS